MGYYLQMDGVDDYLKTPTLTYTKVVIDALPQSSTAIETYFIDASNRSTGGYIRFTNTGAIQNNMNQTGFTLNARTVTTGTLAAAFTGTLAFFARNDGAERGAGNVYDIKVYNGTTLVAHWDFTIQSSGNTVPDQSGNGNTLTIYNGGTWVNDGASAGTTYTGSGVAQGTSNVSSVDSFIAHATASAQGMSDVSAIANVILSAMGTAQGTSTVSGNEIKSFAASGSAQGQSNVTANELIIYLTSGTVNGQSSATANETVVTHNGTVYSESGSAQGVTEITVNERQILSAKGTAQGLSNVSAHELIVLMAQGIADGYSTVTVVDSSMQIIGRIELKGQRDLYVYLKGQRELTINLKGSL